MDNILCTKYGEELIDQINSGQEFELRSEYPRPQMVRKHNWLNLNGFWDYAILERDKTSFNPVGDIPCFSESLTKAITPYQFFESQGKILVPFSPETFLSQVQRKIDYNHFLWYRRQVDLCSLKNQGRYLLHFGAVDQTCSVFINGQYIGSHRDGYLPFSFDITPYIKDNTNSFELSLVVADPQDQGQLPWGKQSSRPATIWYEPTSGIWQTVWLETVPESYIQDVKITPSFKEGSFSFEVVDSLIQRQSAVKYELTMYANGHQLGKVMSRKSRFTYSLNSIYPWEPENPFLYDWTLKLVAEDKETILDSVSGYAGLREIKIGQDKDGYGAILLNGKVLRHIGVLDQGYWPEGSYTPAHEQAFIDDILYVKSLGFNMIRKHIKIEAPAFYYHCDRLGILVWQDMVNGGSDYNEWYTRFLPFVNIKLKDKNNKYTGRLASKAFSFDKEQRKEIGEAGKKAQLAIMEESVRHLYNHPCIVCWVPFNEAWGQFDALEVARKFKEWDETRLVDHASGWHDQGGPDFDSVHIYFKPFRKKAKKAERPLALTEFGGYSFPVQGHTSLQKNYGYKTYKDIHKYRQAVIRLHEKEILPKKNLAATVYTQLSDVEGETNGLLSFDRKVDKWEDKASRQTFQMINRKLQEE